MRFSLIDIKKNVCSQDFPNQDQIGKEIEAKSSNSQLDPDENWKHDQVQLKEKTLAQNKVEAVNVMQSNILLFVIPLKME